MTSLRVAFLIDSLGAGGSERSLAEMLPHLIEAGVKPQVFVLSEPREGFSELVAEAGVQVTVLGDRGWLGRLLDLRRRLSKSRPQLLHTSLFYSDILGRIAALGTGIPVLSSLVSTRYEPERLTDPRVRPWKMKVVRALDGWTGRHLTAHFHAVSTAAKRSAVRWLRIDPAAVTVIQRGRDPKRLGRPGGDRRRDSRLVWGVADDEILIANVGRQTFHKAQLTLLQAFLELRRKGASARLVIAGSVGPSTPDLEGFIDTHKLGEWVTLAGHLEDIPGLLAASDVFAFPSRLEGFPGAVLEALALGLPVVASDIPPLQEIFEHGGGGVLVDCATPDELTRALGEVVANAELRSELGVAGRRLFQERFDIRNTIAPTLELYRKVARGKDR